MGKLFGTDGIRGVVNAGPVSYTHLDVYKRQIHVYPWTGNVRPGGLPVRHRGVPGLYRL